MPIKSLLHASLIVSDIERSVNFYGTVLGLKIDPSRPDLGYPGAWIHVGDAQLHLLQVPNPDPRENRPKHGGLDRHTAMSVTDFAAFVDLLERHKIAYTMSRSGRNALFLRDPDGNALEFVEHLS